MERVFDVYKPLTEITVPYSVWALLGFGTGPVQFSVNSSIILGNDDRYGDSGSLEEWRKAVEYLADQFGGQVTWEKAK